MSFQSSLEKFQWQFLICNVFGQGVRHSGSGDTEASWPEATYPGSRWGEVSPCRRTKVGSRPDYRNGDAGSTEICRATTMEWIPNKGCNFEDDALANGKPMKLIPEHRREVMWSNFLVFMISLARRVENGLQPSQVDYWVWVLLQRSLLCLLAKLFLVFIGHAISIPILN